MIKSGKPDSDVMMLYGRNSVYERLKVRPQTIKKIFLQDSFNVPYIEKLIDKNNIPVKRLSSRQLLSIKSVRDLQGIIARVDKFEYASYKDLLSQTGERKKSLIFLDRLYDPQNLGVIIRTAACFGGFSIVIPRYNACEVTEAVLHVASGGENYVPVSMVSNLSTAIITAKRCGYWIAGGVVNGDVQDIDDISLPFPLGLVLGSEGRGIRYGIGRHLDIKIRIPMRGINLSLNVAMACAIFCYEIEKQRRCDAKSWSQKVT